MSTMTMNSSTSSHSKLKKQLRDVTRFISRPNLPPTILREQERKLQHLQVLLQDCQQAQRLKKLTSRYAKVRFFESKKAHRHLRQASRNLLANPQEENLQKWKEAKKDELYVLNYPHNQKYISLFPSTPLLDAKVLATREQVRANLSDRLDEEVKMDEALAMAKHIVSGIPLDTTVTNETVLQHTTQALSGGNKGHKHGSSEEDEDEGDDDDDEDIEEDDEGDEDDDEEGENDDEGDDNNNNDDDEDDDNNNNDDDEDDDDEEEEEEEDEDDDGENDDDSDEYDDDDEDDDEEEEDDDDDEEVEESEDISDEEEEWDSEEDETEESSPKKARR